MKGAKKARSYYYNSAKRNNRVNVLVQHFEVTHDIRDVGAVEAGRMRKGAQQSCVDVCKRCVYILGVYDVHYSE